VSHSTASSEIDLWAFQTAPLDGGAFDAACGALERARCFYDLLQEQWQRDDPVPRRRLSLRGNLVCPEVRTDPSLQGAAESGLRIRLWTFHPLEERLDVLPYCAGSTPASRGRAGAFGRLLALLSTPLAESDPPPEAERRQFERRSVSIRAHVGYFSPRGRLAGQGVATISDLSGGGARLTDFSMPPGLDPLGAARVVLRPEGGRPFALRRGNIVRLHTRRKTPGLGIEFQGDLPCDPDGGP
jgi:hypothetical protein